MPRWLATPGGGLQSRTTPNRGAAKGALSSSMDHSGEIPVVYENGVFRPETPVSFPEHARLRILVRDGDGPRAQGQSNGLPLMDALDRLRSRGLIRTAGWRPTRDELHERG